MGRVNSFLDCKGMLVIHIQFGGARLLRSRLARTLAPPRMQTVPLPGLRDVADRLRHLIRVHLCSFGVTIDHKYSAPHLKEVEFCALICVNVPSLKPASMQGASARVELRL